MKHPVASLLLLVLTLVPQVTHAQEEADDNPKFNTNRGWPISTPLGAASRVSGVGTGLTYGAGYNFTRRHALVGEFLWDWLNAHGNGHSDLYTFTGNYRFELRGRLLGGYLIAGGGWYWRRSSIPDLAVFGSSSTALGASGGAGFTIRVSDAPYRLYFESRYHYAPTKPLNTRLIVTTIGIRY